MWQFLIGLCLLFASFWQGGSVVSFDLVRTAGGHLGAHFILGTNNTVQYRFLLFDMTATGLWTFVSTLPVENTDYLPGPFDISKENLTQFKDPSKITAYDLSYKFFATFGYYDQPLQTVWIPFNIKTIIAGNTTLRNMSTTILGIDAAFYPNFEFWNRNLFDGVFGIGKGLNDIVPNSNFTAGWIKNTSTVLLYTPRDTATAGKLIIDSTVAPAECKNVGLAVNLSKVVYLRSTDYEFNITAVAGNSDGSVYAYEKTWPATLSTMSAMIAVDNTTWNWIVSELKPVADPYAVPGSDLPRPFYKVKCSAVASFRLAITMTDQLSGRPFPFLIPGSALIKPNPYGDCLLRVQPNAADFWVLGIPFLENYCFQLNPAASEIIFMNTTVSAAYPPPPQTTTFGQSQLFMNVFNYKPT